MSSEITDTQARKPSLAGPRLFRPDSAPLSFAQQRLWFLDQLHPGSPLYTIAVAVRLRGRLHLPALRQAIAAVQARHEVLRMHIVSLDGEPTAAVRDATVTFDELPLIDLSALTDSERARELQRRLQHEARRPFDLAADNLLRTLLFRLGSNEHVFFVSMHHIASDWFSFAIFFRELSHFYRAFPDAAPLPVLPLQYADYAGAQQSKLTSDQLRASLEYWKQQLAGAPEWLELPTDRPRPATTSFRGDRRLRTLPATLTSALRELSRREAVTPFMLLLAAFNTLLYRLTHQEDILAGAPITGRDRPGTDRLIGFFSNTIVLRSRSPASMSFREFLRQVKATALAAFTHQDLPFEKLVEELRPDRAVNHTPLIQVMFTLQSAWSDQIALPGIEATVDVLDTGTSKFELTLAITTTKDDWFAEMEFNSDLFDGPTIERWLGHYETLLRGIVANPEIPLGQAPLLTDTERHRLLVEWNDTQCNFPTHKSVIELFEEQAREQPEAIAIVSDAGQCTFGEVNTRANQLAHCLRSLGVGPEVVVGICSERNPHALIAMLAILKAGGAFLPMDPSDPPERLRFMIEDARVALLLTQEKFADRFSPPPRQMLFLDTLDVTQEPGENLAPLADAENLAYVIYTSGSTGEAKGVQITRQSLLNHNLAISQIYELSPADRVLQFAALSFDVAIEEILPSWLRGCAVILRPNHALGSIPQFLEFVERERITVLNLPTAFWHAFVEALPAAVMPRCVRCLIIGGEKASLAHYRAWKEHVGEKIKLINAYGLTETTITSTVYTGDTAAHPDALPIGRPIADTQAFILDPSLQPVPIGVFGELYLGGEGVARGYLNRPALTAERFVQNPFATSPSPLYRTGDLARWLPDGNIEFAGRLDHQVKIRGFRVELGEIEAHLRHHPKIRDAVVIARDGPAGTQLAGYILTEANLAVADLRDHLHKRLPEYMIPAAFVLLDEFPLTPNGKVDRRALPAPSYPLADGDSESDAAPRTEIEKALCEIWCALLNLPRVGIHDNYFRLGGHSLLAIRVAFRIRDAFQVELPMSSIFEAPTIAELALLIQSRIIQDIQQLSDAEAELLVAQMV